MTDDTAPITHEEMIEMFGEEMPLEAISLIWNAPGEMTAGEARAKLRQIARERKTPSLVERLKSAAVNWSATCGGLFGEAANEIERLKSGAANHDLVLAKIYGGVREIPTEYDRQFLMVASPSSEPYYTGATIGEAREALAKSATAALGVSNAKLEAAQSAEQAAMAIALTDQDERRLSEEKMQPQARSRRSPGDNEVVSIVLAIEAEAAKPTVGAREMAFLAKEAARVIRRLRPDLAFNED